MILAVVMGSTFNQTVYYFSQTRRTFYCLVGFFLQQNTNEVDKLNEMPENVTHHYVLIVFNDRREGDDVTAKCYFNPLFTSQAVLDNIIQQHPCC